MILFYDTETTGLPLFNEPSDDPAQPRICQLAAMLTNDSGDPFSMMSVLIEPNGWRVPDDVAAIHGITTEKCEAGGVPIKLALQAFEYMALGARVDVGHNVSFDNRMLRIEWKKAGRGVFADRWREERTRFCTMRKATPVINLPPTEKMMASGRKGPKSPSLPECMRYFFDEDFTDQAHDALADVIACKRVYFQLQALRLEGSAGAA